MSWLSAITSFFDSEEDDCRGCDGCECDDVDGPEVTCTIYVTDGEPIVITREIEDTNKPYAEFEAFMRWFNRADRHNLDTTFTFTLASGFFSIKRSNINRVHVECNDWIDE